MILKRVSVLFYLMVLLNFTFANEEYFPRLTKDIPLRSEAKILAFDGKLIVYGGQLQGKWWNDIWVSVDQGESWKRECAQVFSSEQSPQGYELLTQGNSFFAVGGYTLDANGRKRMNTQVLISETLNYWELFKTIPLKNLNPQFSRWHSTGERIYYIETINSRNAATQMWEVNNFEKWKLTGLDFSLHPERRNAHTDFDAIKMFMWKGNEYWIQNDAVSPKQPKGHYTLKFITPKWSYDIDMSKTTVVPRDDAVYLFDYRMRQNGEWYSKVMRSSDLVAWTEVMNPGSSGAQGTKLKRTGYATAVDKDYLYLFGGNIGDWYYDDLFRSKDLFNWEIVVPKDLFELVQFKNMRTIVLKPNKQSDEDVRIMQAMINKALQGFSDWTPLVEDGIFGSKTMAAVKKIWDVQYPFEMPDSKKIVNQTFWDALVVMGHYEKNDLISILAKSQ